MVERRLTFYEFFCGGGMARLGLGRQWRCLLANDICAKKAAAYRMNFPPSDELLVRDVAMLTSADLPGHPILAWASFPCQDLSLAGDRMGLKGERSGTFWPFWRLMKQMADDGRPVPIVALENVVGAVSSHDGRDFRAILSALASEGYSVGPLVIDARHFLPQSRPRLFIIAVRNEVPMPSYLTGEAPDDLWHPDCLRNAYANAPAATREAWVWWSLPRPPKHTRRFSDIVEEQPTGVKWHDEKEAQRLVSLMSEVNLAKVRAAQKAGVRVVGTIYKRTRVDDAGRKAQRAEVRFDEVSGCLRTPVGGSSRQIVIVVEGQNIRTRLLSPREAARLMGVRDSYVLPHNYNEAYHLMGDGLAVPAVRWIESHLLRSIAAEVEHPMEVA